MKFILQPLYDRVLVERIPEEIKTQGGLYIPDTVKEKPTQGRIVAAGNGRIKEDGSVTPLCVKEGNRVLFGKYAGTEIKQDGVEYLMMREEDILAIVNVE